MDEMRRSPPDVILSMGVSDQAKVEEKPENRLVGVPGAGEVIAGGPAVLPTDLPVSDIERSLQGVRGRSGQGGPDNVQTSGASSSYHPDRSAYLCNYLGYSLAHEYGKTPTGFVHITADTPSGEMRAILEAVVAKQLDARRSGRS